MSAPNATQDTNGVVLCKRCWGWPKNTCGCESTDIFLRNGAEILLNAGTETYMDICIMLGSK